MGRPMRRPPRPTLLLAAGAALACLFAASPSALADSALDQYQRSGRIDPCTASSGGGIPNDVEQYAPDFLEALKDAQRRGCDRGVVSQTKPTETTKNGVPVASGGTLPPGSTYVPKPPAPPKTFRDDKVVRHLPLASGREVTTPAPVIVLAVLALLALVGGALVGTSRYMGWGLERFGAVRHAFGELGLRLRNLTRRGL
jgi:hypothetical protein